MPTTEMLQRFHLLGCAALGTACIATITACGGAATVAPEGSGLADGGGAGAGEPCQQGGCAAGLVCVIDGDGDEGTCQADEAPCKDSLDCDFGEVCNKKTGKCESGGEEGGEDEPEGSEGDTGEGGEGAPVPEGLEGFVPPEGGEGTAEGAEALPPEGVEAAPAEGTEGTEGTPAPCANDAQCPVGQHCAAGGKCVECFANIHCSASGAICDVTSQKCVPGCATDTDCGDVLLRCKNNKCESVDACDPPCESGQECNAGKCEAPKPCPQGCGAGEICFGGQCVKDDGCNPPCQAPLNCVNSACVPANQCNPACGPCSDCVSNACVEQTCVPACGAGQTCECDPVANTKSCKTPAGTCNPACGAGFECQNGNCVEKACNPPCSGTDICDHGVCVPGAQDCNPPCGKGTICDFTQATPQCIEGCNSDADCPPSSSPNNTKCFDISGGFKLCVQCTSDADCGGGKCDLGFYECTGGPASCNPPCGANETCQGTTCVPNGTGKCGQPCTDHIDCFPDGLLCGLLSKKCFCP